MRLFKRNHIKRNHIAFWWALLAPLCAATGAAKAQDAYTSADNNFSFKYPKRWKVTAESDSVHLTSPDGNGFVLRIDALKTLPSGPPTYDAGVRDEATRLATKVLPKAQLVRAQTAVVDHGAGAVFRFQASQKDDTAGVVAVWIAIIGRHSLAIVPDRAAQSGEAIGLTTVVESATFADALPRPRVPLARAAPAAPGSGTQGAAAMNRGPHTVDFDTQIAPILGMRCRSCHNSGSALGGLSVVTFADFIKGGDHGALATPGRPGTSLLMDYLTGKRDRMPKGSAPLSSDQIDLFRTWIQEGATKGSGSPAPATTAPGIAGGSVRQTRPRRQRAAPAGAALLEAYTGHLVISDTGFALQLLRDGTATADWSFSPTVSAHFTGVYRGENGSYAVALTLAAGSNPYQAKKIVLDLRPHGDAEIGRFGLDTDQPRRDIAALSLTGIDVSFRPRAAPAKRKPGR